MKPVPKYGSNHPVNRNSRDTAAVADEGDSAMSVRGSICLVLALAMIVCTPVAGVGLRVSEASVNPKTGHVAYVCTVQDVRKLIIVREPSHIISEIPLSTAVYAPFWDGDRVCLVDAYASLRIFSVGKAGWSLHETRVLGQNAVRGVEFDEEYRILYLIETVFLQAAGDVEKKSLSYRLVAYDLQADRRLVEQEIRTPGKLCIIGCMLHVIRDGEVVGSFSRAVPRTATPQQHRGQHSK
jgi:hypothetical protein